MSIVPLFKVRLVGLAREKKTTLRALQELGCLHLILRTTSASQSVHGASDATTALGFLAKPPRFRRQVRDPTLFDAPTVQAEILTLRRRLQDLHDEREFLLARVKALAVWGDFELPPLEELAGNRLWFYVLPNHLVRRLDAVEVPWEVVGRDARSSYVVAVSPEEPSGMPVERVRTGAKSRRALEERLDQVELELEDGDAAHARLTRWYELFADSVVQLDERARRREAASGTWDDGPLFALEAWAPQSRAEELERFATSRGLALELMEPVPGEAPPTLLRNPSALSGGEDLVTFYMTPGYSTWDPSGVVLYGFALFFAAIVSDAGYALVLALLVAPFWRRMAGSDVGTRLRRATSTCIGAALGYGVIVGSYWGVTPHPDSPLGALHVLDVRDAALMMPLSVLVGGLHITLANAIEAKRQGWSVAALPPVGWASVVVGMLLWGASTVAPSLDAELARAGQIAMALGASLVFLFTARQGSLVQRALGGLIGLTRLSGLFGDVLSYLRLFALGLASASLAVAFNDLAAQVRGALGPPGMVPAAAIAVVGHALNLVLAVTGAVVHGLRLNAIEFFNWSLTEEGRPFRHFRRKERAKWNRSF